MMESIDSWSTLAEEVNDDIGFARCGVFYLAETESKLNELEEWLEVAHAHQLDTRIIGRSGVDALISDAEGQWCGALHTPSDGRAEPFKAVPAIARALRRRGGLIRENCAVRALDIEAGSVVGVITESGRVRTQAVVCAAGAWSSMLVGHHNIN